MDALVLGDFSDYEIVKPRSNKIITRSGGMKILLLNLYFPPDTSATAKMAQTVVERPLQRMR